MPQTWLRGPGDQDSEETNTSYKKRPNFLCFCWVGFEQAFTQHFLTRNLDPEAFQAQISSRIQQKCGGCRIQGITSGMPCTVASAHTSTQTACPF